MYDSDYIWPSSDMDLLRINNTSTSVRIRWSRNYFEDYRTLAYQFYECGYKTFEEVICREPDNIKTDTWFLTGLFLVRHSLELGLKALLCRVYLRNSDIQNAFEECCHDVSLLFKRYSDIGAEKYLTDEEENWLTDYLISLEEVDHKSDIFRFPFEDEFLSKYQDKYLNCLDVANNLLQGFALVKKCIEQGTIDKEDEFDNKREPEFFIFASNGFGNCYLWHNIFDDGFHAKVTGYTGVINYIYHDQRISNETKLYPLIFMLRNTIELCLKRIFYSRAEHGVTLWRFNSKRKSHLLIKDLWKNVRPVVEHYADENNEDLTIIDVVENLLRGINSLDKIGDMFRYPTSYSLEYRINDLTMDLSNVYTYFMAIINFLDSFDSMLAEYVDFESEMRMEYYSELREGIDW